MFRRLSVIAPFILASSLLAADLAEKWSKRLESADANYQSAVQKADNVRFYAVQKATQERIKVLKTALTDATKSGDFDAATEIKSRLAAAETAITAPPKTKPTNVTRFGGHEYSIIPDKVVWHVAKRMCEEMGGHLVTLDTTAEAVHITELCKQAGIPIWAGGTDEEFEGRWKWVTGRPVEIEFSQNNGFDSEHYLAYWPQSGGWQDNGAGRYAFMCEWDN